MNEKASERRTSGKKVVGVIAVLVATAVAVVLIFRTTGPDEQAFDQVDPAARAQLYARELRTFEELCLAEPPAESPRNCQEAAQLLEAFPECDASCRQAIERFRQRLQR